MSYAKVETTVRLHPKFLKAGPEASWLWACGLMYCQEALTDGFIADATLPFLGVPKPARLAAVLVDVCLWHREGDGWRIHDYLKHNNSADDIKRIQKERQEAGRRGGRNRRNQVVKQFAKAFVEQDVEQLAKAVAKPSVAVATSVSVQTEKQERADASASPVENPESRILNPERVERLNDLIRQHRRRRSRETDNGKPAAEVIRALARHVVRQSAETDDGELRELLKAACARANLRYDGVTVSRALDQALARRRKVAAS